MKSKKTGNITLSAMFMAIGYVLPFLTGQIPEIGKMMLPMHIPVFLCGLICGWQYGLAVGVILPVTRSIIFGMPAMYPNAISMMFELGAYGFIIGILYERSKWKCIRSLYRCLIAAMIGGRIVWGLIMSLMLGIGSNGFTIQAFIAGAVIKAVPGIVLQLALIPCVMVALGRTKLVVFHKNSKNDLIETAKQ